MTNRKEIELDRFKKDVNRVWSLSLVEEEALNILLNFFLEREVTKIQLIINILKN